MIEDDLKAAFAKEAMDPSPGFEARTAAAVHARWRRRSQKLRNALVFGLAATTACIVVARAGIHKSAPPPPAPPALQAGVPDRTIRDLRDEARAQRTKIRADIELAEIELRRELEKDSPDEKRVVALIDKISGLEGQARKTEVLASLKIRALLPKEQRKKVESMPQKEELVDPLEGLYGTSDPEREYERAKAAHGTGLGIGKGKSTAAGEGSLSVNSIPAALVHIDGREIGWTPLLKVTLTPGKHSVEMTSGDRKWVGIVEIRPGEDARLTRRFDGK